MREEHRPMTAFDNLSNEDRAVAEALLAEAIAACRAEGLDDGDLIAAVAAERIVHALRGRRLAGGPQRRGAIAAGPPEGLAAGDLIAAVAAERIVHALRERKLAGDPQARRLLDGVAIGFLAQRFEEEAAAGRPVLGAADAMARMIAWTRRT